MALAVLGFLLDLLLGHAQGALVVVALQEVIEGRPGQQHQAEFPGQLEEQRAQLREQPAAVEARRVGDPGEVPLEDVHGERHDGEEGHQRTQQAAEAGGGEDVSQIVRGVEPRPVGLQGLGGEHEAALRGVREQGHRQGQREHRGQPLRQGQHASRKKWACPGRSPRLPVASSRSNRPRQRAIHICGCQESARVSASRVSAEARSRERTTWPFSRARCLRRAVAFSERLSAMSFGRLARHPQHASIQPTAFRKWCSSSSGHSPTEAASRA